MTVLHAQGYNKYVVEETNLSTADNITKSRSRERKDKIPAEKGRELYLSNPTKNTMSAEKYKNTVCDAYKLTADNTTIHAVVCNII